MTIVLLGYRGSGKSSVGRILASRLGVEFVDTDALVVTRAGMSIAEIFARQGEVAFRDLESQVLEDAMRWLGDRVIATGGGIVVREPNRTLLTRSGAYRVYLKSDAATLHARIAADAASAASRPALTSLGGGVDEIAALLAVREPLYREVMTREIDVTHLTAKEVALMIAGDVQSDSLRCFPG